MSTFYESFGFFMYWSYIALMMIVLVYSFGLASSYTLVCIVAVFYHGRWRQVRWHMVPGEFLANWRKWLSNGPPTSITSTYVEWRGILNWKILPKEKP